MRKYKILAVEDEPTTQALLQHSLSSIYDLKLASSLKLAHECLTHFKADLILLDIHLPDGNGFDFFDSLKDNTLYSRIPVMFLSFESDIKLKVKSFSAGAYDYITKPFNESELIARINAHCLRSEEINFAHYTPSTFGSLILDSAALQVYSANDKGEKELVALSPTEYKLLEYFISHAGKTLSREQISKNVWNRTHFQSRTVDRHISSLRKKLRPTGINLKTISHSGYLLSTDTETPK
jgi:DNA-binding response OmpR family regulator